MSKAPFPVQEDLTAIALGFTNEMFVADQVLPRVTVGSEEFTYLKHNKKDRFQVPDTRVGRKGQPNQVEFGATDVTDSTVDHALDDVIPQKDMNQKSGSYDPEGEAVEGLSELILLAREKRVADLVFDAANYVATQKATLSGTDQWNDFANSDPIDDILSAMDAMIMRPNTFVMGRAVFTKLRQHPKIAKATHGNSGDVAIVARQAMAEVLEVQNIIVGETWYNSANPGQAENFGRLWGKHAALLHINPAARPRRGLTFGMTAQWGDRMAGSWFDENVGMRGGQVVRVGESVKELVTVSEAGYLFTNAVA